MVPVRTVEDFEGAFSTMSREHVAGFFVVLSPVDVSHRARLANLALKHRLPGMFGTKENVEAGGLMSYSADFNDMVQRAATYIDKILKGAKPADLPVEQASKYELVINLKTAKAIGLTISEAFLLPADILIEYRYCFAALHKEHIEMISRRTTMLNILVVGTMLAAGGLPAFGESRRPSTIQKLDTDNDATLDLNEVKKAGAALFDKLDHDHDGTLDRRELRGRLNAKEFAAADPDKDGTLTKDEYLAVVERRFKAADPDNDGTLDAKELSTRAGRALLRLLQ